MRTHFERSNRVERNLERVVLAIEQKYQDPILDIERPTNGTSSGLEHDEWVPGLGRYQVVGAVCNALADSIPRHRAREFPIGDAQVAEKPGTMPSGEVDIAYESRFTCTFQQAKQRRAFCGTRPASDDDNDAAVSLSRRKLDEVVAVTRDQQAILLMSECKDEGVCGLLREYIAHTQELVAEFLE